MLVNVTENLPSISLNLALKHRKEVINDRRVYKSRKRSIISNKQSI